MNSNIPDNDRQFLIDLAGKIKSKKLNVPSIFFLEMMKPLSFISSQAMIFFGPIFSAFIKPDSYYRAAEIFENRDNIEFLLKEIEKKIELR